MPFKTLQFRYPWRAYQQRVLDAVQSHLDDQRLHVVAAPGAGKTTLGLEIFRRLGMPAFVLSPTRVIRDQWLERLTDFCDIDDVSQLDWASNSIHDPKILTSVTYQALHSQIANRASAKEEAEDLNQELKSLKKSELNNFIQTLEQHQVKVLFLDEAHHLKAEWWKSLEKVVSHFPDMTLVSLTATPPYDVSGREWQRYKQLCGPIDEEISIPELVKAGTLCPHQDYIWASNATTGEIKKVLDYDQAVDSLCQSLLENSEFREIISVHPWQRTKEIETELVRNPEIAVAILLFNKTIGIPNFPHLLNLLALSEDELPEIDRRWWQILIGAVIASKTFEHSEQHQEFVDQLKRQLRANNLLHRNVLSIDRSNRVERSLSLSSSKIESCVQIHQLELEQRGHNLRQVVLTDFIRDESLNSGVITGELDLGAWPIFEQLISHSPVSNQIGLLTGRLCVISEERSELLLKQLKDSQISLEKISSRPGFLKVSAPTSPLIKAYTALLASGELKTVVGTRALLGEGWDAPAVNSLILASSVGSFVLTNQMRGRAIRIDPNNKNKVSSIWHLVAINTRSFSGRTDYHNLIRRFETFVGLSEEELVIESGFNRLGASQLEKVIPVVGHSQLESSNAQMKARFQNLQDVTTRWQQSLIIDPSAKITPAVRMNQPPQIRRYLFSQSKNHLGTQLGLTIGSLTCATVWLTNAGTLGQLSIYPAVGLALPLVFRLPKTARMLKQIASQLPADGSLRQIGNALVLALCIEGHIKSPQKLLDLHVGQTSGDSYSISLSGCTYYESSLFADCIAEILSPIDNPRYLVIRKGKVWGKERAVYHAVPAILGANKGSATTFHQAWQRYVSPSDLVFTRSSKGRGEMIKAQTVAYSAPDTNNIKKHERWE